MFRLTLTYTVTVHDAGTPRHISVDVIASAPQLERDGAVICEDACRLIDAYMRRIDGAQLEVMYARDDITMPRLAMLMYVEIQKTMCPEVCAVRIFEAHQYPHPTVIGAYEVDEPSPTMLAKVARYVSHHLGIGARVV